METFNLELPDGRVLEGVPVGTSKEEIAKKLGVPTDWKGTLQEVGRVADTSIRGGVSALPDLMSLLEQGVSWPARKLSQVVTGAAEMPAELEPAIPHPWEVAKKLIGEPNRPQTTLGKYAGSIGEGAVASMFPGKLAETGVRTMIGGLAGLGAEGAGQLSAGGDPNGKQNPLARIAGGLLTGGLAAGGHALTPNWKSMSRKSMSGVSDADFAKARDMESVLTGLDMPHLKSQLLGPSSSLDDLVQQASQNPQVRPTLLKAVEDISNKSMEVVKNWRARTLPVAAGEARGVLLDTQKTAKDAIDTAVAGTNKAFRDAMPAGGSYSAGYVKSLAADLITLAKSERYGKTSVGGEKLLQFVTDKLAPYTKTGMEQAHLNNLVKDLNALTKTEGWKGLPTNDLKQVLKSYTPEFDAAREAKTLAMAADVKPIRQGLAGQIAQMGGGPTDNKYTMTQNVLNLVFPADKAQGIAITQLGDQIGGAPVGVLLGEHLIRNMEKAAKGYPGSVNAPHKFVEAVLGTPAQRTNTEAALAVAAKAQGLNPTAVRRGFFDWINAFASYKDLKIASGLSSASSAFEAGKSISGAAIAPQSRMGRWLWERTSTKTYQKIADTVTAPEGLKILEQIARTKDPARKRILLQSLIATTTAEDNSPDVTN